MKNIVPDYRLDMVGEPCPYPAVATLEAMPQLKKGEILEVVSDCPQSINNIPLDARNHGYTVLDIQQDGPTIRYLIQNKRMLPLYVTAGDLLRRNRQKSKTHKRNQTRSSCAPWHKSII